VLVHKQPGTHVTEAGPARVGARQGDEPVRLGAGEDRVVHRFGGLAGKPSESGNIPRDVDPASRLSFQDAPNRTAQAFSQPTHRRADVTVPEWRDVPGIPENRAADSGGRWLTHSCPASPG
jgi:hypothetical protein